MSTTNLLLLKPVEDLGNEGDQVKVSAGYARNFLLPKGIAIHVTKANRKQVESLQAARERRLTKEREGAEVLAGKLSTARIAIAVKTGPGGKLFGSVTGTNLQERLKEEGIEIERKLIGLYAPVKTLGKHSTKIRLHAEITVDFEFEVVSENPIDTGGKKDSLNEESSD